MNKIEQAVIYNKVLGSLACAGMDDALGAAIELYSIDEIKAQWGGFLNAFVSPPADAFAGSLNGIAGLITDDSSQMYIFPEELVKARFDNFTNNDWLTCLLRWADMQPYANYKGPTTEQIVKALEEGRSTNTIGRIGTSPCQVPNVGTTNGAGMRVALAGLIWPGKKEKTCHLVLITCLSSHGTNIATASACAIAAVTSQAMLPESSLTSLLDAAVWGANYDEHLAKRYARCVIGPSIAMRIQLTADIARRANDLEPCLREMEGLVGNSVAAYESIPAVIGLLLYCEEEPWKTIHTCANIGNDTDSIATMAGAIAGAWRGFDTLPEDKYALFHAVNNRDFDIEAIASGLTLLTLQAQEK